MIFSRLLSNQVVSLPKTIIFIRHGTTEMNEYFSKHPWGSPNFIDPIIWDTRLTETGISQAESLNKRLWNSVYNYDSGNNWLGELINTAEIIVSSPLTRCLQTANYVFKDLDFLKCWNNRLVLPLCSERCYTASEVGRSREELEKDFNASQWEFSLLPHNTSWWYKNSNFDNMTSSITNNIDGSVSSDNDINNDGKDYVEWRPLGKYVTAGEPSHIFRQRMIKMRQWLIDRPENVIVVVCHWGVIRALTGKSVKNCDLLHVNITDLLLDPFIDH